jgi:phosphoglycerate dehydrogenase-like enzyme
LTISSGEDYVVRNWKSEDLDLFDRHIATSDLLIGYQFPTDRLSEKAPHLKWIHFISSGVEHIRPFDWVPPNIKLVNNRGVHLPKSGEFIAMALAMLNAEMPRLYTAQKEKRWDRAFTTVIRGKTLVVIGVGQQGGTAAKQARKMGLRVIGVDLYRRKHRYCEKIVTPADMGKVLPEADFVVVTVPWTSETEKMIGRRELELLPSHAGLINISRAITMDYEALVEKLTLGQLGGAILDVFQPEPLRSDSFLWSTPNLIITPHVSSDDRDNYIPRTLDLALDNVRRYLRGRPLRNQVNLKREC